jgi:RNA recognition motif-containing protein
LLHFPPYPPEDNAHSDPKIHTDPYKTLFVSRLHRDTTEETLRGIFGKWGKIQSLRLVRDIGVWNSKHRGG